ncbi:recombinase family protein [Anaerovibrio lipolyticus]|uniref:recombinase family protein n=1 Tax=Anaerovibrio lipolyticus TaxID=82374 RepID=UPI000487FACA|nr:recombinase family protein [Anaerovibrio lipolyticus]
MSKLRAAGYVKLAKLWEKSKDKVIEVTSRYFVERYANDENISVQGIYIDITGNKNIYRRPEMVHLLRDCSMGQIDVICVQTRAYLAANTEELFFLLNYLFELEYRVDIKTDDNDRRIDTLLNSENQRTLLRNTAVQYVNIKKDEYKTWLGKLEKAMDKIK